MNILEFVSSKLAPERQLYPAQQTLAKIAYGLPLTEEEAVFFKTEFSSPVDMCFNTLAKSRTEPNKFLAILGRRCGKDFMSMVFAYYEAYRKIKEVDKFGTDGDDSFIIVSPSSYGKIMSDQLRNTIETSIPFAEKEILVTKKEGQIKIQSIKNKNNAVTIHFAPSYNRILGLKCSFMLCSEMWSFTKEKTNAILDFANISTAICPSLKLFVFTSARIETAVKDEDCHPIYRIFHPETMAGYDWISISAPSWIVNTNLSKESLRKEIDSDERFRTEFKSECIRKNVPEPESEQITFRIKRDLLEKIKKEARKRSFEDNIDFMHTDIIRELLEERFGR